MNQPTEEQQERVKQRGPAWTCALCGTYCESTEELKSHVCPTRVSYRIIRYGNGYEAAIWTQSGGGGWFWTPLLVTGYWAEPESFSTGTVKGLHLLDTFGEAEKAIERAKLINETGGVLNIADTK